MVENNSGNPVTANTILYSSARNIDPGNTGSSITYSAGQEGTITKARSKSVSAPLNQRSFVLDLVHLTVVNSIPTANSFRPAPNARTKESKWTTSDLNFSLLPNLTPPGSAPSMDSLVWVVDGAYQHGINDGTKQNINPEPKAGREYATATGNLALGLCFSGWSSTAAKQRAAILMVQNGLDIYERVVQDQGIWADDGQLNCGRKIPLVVAARLLGDPGIEGVANGLNQTYWGQGYKGCISPRLGVPSCDGPVFMEDRQHFYVSQTLINNPPTEPWSGNPVPPTPYPQSMLGKAEWGIEAWTWPNKNNYSNGAAYRPQNIQYAVSTTLAARLMGAESLWNYPAYFDYVERMEGWWKVQTSGGGQVPQWNKDAWDLYR